MLKKILVGVGVLLVALVVLAIVLPSSSTDVPTTSTPAATETPVAEPTKAPVITPEPTVAPEPAEIPTPEPAPTAAPAIAPEPIDAPAPTEAPQLNLPACVDTDCNCSDFTYQVEAQVVFNAFSGDPYGLDRDGNGLACESLP